VHTKCQIIYTLDLLWRCCIPTSISDGRNVVDCCKGTAVCEVGSDVLTGYCVLCVDWVLCVVCCVLTGYCV
jgi:hypothetical protein